MRLLVTGGAGYIGSVCARHLATLGHMVVIYDSLERGHAAAAGDLPMLQGTLQDTNNLASLMRDYRIEAVVHFAAYAQVGESVAQPHLYFSNNVGGTLSLALAMAECGVRRIVFSSTAAVYGDPDQLPISESAPTRPTNPYGHSKRVAEQLLAGFAASGMLSGIALRYFNAAGAALDWGLGEHHEPETHLIPLVLEAVERQQPMKIFGIDYPTPDGTCIRDYVHVLDLAAAHAAALDRLARIETGSFESINLGTGTGASVKEVLTTAGRVTGSEVPHQVAPRRPGDPPHLVASYDLARERLGWTPRHTLEEIIASAWEWHRAHPGGYKD